ncbi:MAG: hypothetical protein ACQEP0_16100 [Natrinema limicola]
MTFISALVGSGIFVMFLAVLIGMGFGRINFGRGIKFGVAGPLFAGLVLGHFGFTVPGSYSGLTLALFVAAVGLIAAHEIEGTVKTYGLNFLVISVFMPTIAVVFTYVWAVFVFPDASTGLIMGSFSGALTSSPGLGSAVEALPEAAAQQYQIGHSVGYVIGVLIIVMFQQLYPLASGMDIASEKRQFTERVSAIGESDGVGIEEVSFSVLGFGLVLVLGAVLGSIPIPLGPIGAITLGTTGGVLISALVLGYVGKIGPIETRMETGILSEIRALTLAMFLAVTGIDAGAGLVETIMEYGVQIVVASGLNSVLAIIGGLILTRTIWNMNWIHAAGGIVGGHTDTKGLAAAIDATDSDEVAAGYGNTYPFALLAMVIYAKLLVAVVPL